MRAQAERDDELRVWSQAKESHAAVQAGARGTRQLRWSLKVVRPDAGDPEGFYDEFVTRWRDYVASRMTPGATAAAVFRTRGRSPASAETTEAPPRQRQRADPPERPPVPEDEPSPPRRRGRSPAAAEPAGEPKRRRSDLRGWLQPRSSRTDETLSGHGRATTGSTH